MGHFIILLSTITVSLFSFVSTSRADTETIASILRNMTQSPVPDIRISDDSIACIVFKEAINVDAAGDTADGKLLYVEHDLHNDSELYRMDLGECFRDFNPRCVCDVFSCEKENGFRYLGCRTFDVRVESTLVIDQYAPYGYRYDHDTIRTDYFQLAGIRRNGEIKFRKYHLHPDSSRVFGNVLINGSLIVCDADRNLRTLTVGQYGNQNRHGSRDRRLHSDGLRLLPTEAPQFMVPIDESRIAVGGRYLCYSHDFERIDSLANMWGLQIVDFESGTIARTLTIVLVDSLRVLQTDIPFSNWIAKREENGLITIYGQDSQSNLAVVAVTGLLERAIPKLKRVYRPGISDTRYILGKIHDFYTVRVEDTCAYLLHITESENRLDVNETPIRRFVDDAVANLPETE